MAGVIIIRSETDTAYFPIKSFPVKIGRSKDNDIVLSGDPFISKKHCQIHFENGEYWLTDLDSKNGTYLNGKRVILPTTVSLGKNVIYLGKTIVLLVEKEPSKRATSSGAILKKVTKSGRILIPSTRNFNQRVEETLFLVDICKSTEIAHQYGEPALLQIIYALQLAVFYLAKDQAEFLKFTKEGDGFFARFNDTKTALRSAMGIFYMMDKTLADHPKLPKPGLKVSIHRGQVYVDKDGDPKGLDCTLIFRLDKINKTTLVQAPANAPELPETNRIILTEPALKSLPPVLADACLELGLYQIKDFANPIKIFLFQPKAETLLALEPKIS